MSAVPGCYLYVLIIYDIKIIILVFEIKIITGKTVAQFLVVDYLGEFKYSPVSPDVER